MTTNTDEAKHVKLFLRADAEVGVERTKEAAVEKLAELDAAGRIADYDVHVWGRELRADGPLTNTGYGGELLGYVKAFKEWAREHDISLEATFKERTIESSFADEQYKVVSLPTICIAVYDGDQVASVYPCHTGGRDCSAVEYLETFESEQRISTLPA
ncbi:hypothetical protein C453_00085 [Haloferax elongans ATCC BAA-1513]|uniref:Uncharacterized protein n=1 Tax=Haloferax elongans ATCC BAA-1513 TaxID=1230453 RepID=M0I0N8_HALEO|nr:HTH domain-containing protein [Haloferax elongans]ELZ89568.1 hypothetical protein C453_00085 [Haloferax elongans ATCC BAA-1513]